jgi:hypothetical protein
MNHISKIMNNLWDEEGYYYGVGANYILECGDADMAIDDTLDANRLRWVEGEGYKRWTPHKLNQLAMSSKRVCQGETLVISGHSRNQPPLLKEK